MESPEFLLFLDSKVEVGSPLFAGLSIGTVLFVAIQVGSPVTCIILLKYSRNPQFGETAARTTPQALGGISGGNFNPAVSVALGCVNSLKGPGMEWKQVAAYCVVQAGGWFWGSWKSTIYRIG